MRVALWGGFCVVPLLVDPLGWDAWQPIRGLALGGMVLLLGLVFWRVLPAFYKALPQAVLPALLVLCGVGVLQAEDSGLAAAYIAPWWVVLFALVLLIHPLEAWATLRDDLWRAMSVALLLQLAVEIVQELELLPGLPAGSMSNGNFRDGWLLCLLPGAAALSMGGPGFWRWIGYLALLGGLAAVLGGRTMGAVLGLMALVPVYGLAAGMRRWPQWGRRPGLIALAVVMILGLGAAGFYGYWQQRVTQAYAEGDPRRVESEEERVQLWGATVKMIARHPEGIGPGQWPAHVLDQGIVGERAGFGTRLHMHTHNDFLEITAEYGWLGGICFVLLLGFALWKGWRRVASGEDWRDDLAAVGMVVAWMAFACTNYPAAQVEFLWLLAVGLAMLLRKQVKGRGRAWMRLLLGLMVLALIAGIWLNAKWIREERHTRAMVGALWDGDWQAMALAGEQAEAAGMAAERFSGRPSAWYAGAGRLWSGDAAGALAPLARAYALARVHPQVAYAYGLALMGAEAHRQAAEVLGRTVAHFPEFDWARMACVEALLAAGEKAAACRVAGHWRDVAAEAPDFQALVERACGD